MSEFKTYVVGAEKAYRDGVVYQEGQKITLPVHVKPSKTFFHEDGTPVDPKAHVASAPISDEEKALLEEFRAKKAAKAPEPKPAKTEGKPGRAADKDAI